ncbi:iron complex outermembrane receptor protein [Rhizomicrobium palustre]|uniref:Iron complex outermembrane receptor protein n=1 Tax=Rhizomicrobium palustre TaxID=189966 RepID=A0A846N0K0_9PROT|nr:TonB-dependent receptor [Rhizomicrobium palustre]NIK88772.1 iron complex outermembrane receptor protein [Rhizomicrobium palustre]
MRMGRFGMSSSALALLAIAAPALGQSEGVFSLGRIEQVTVTGAASTPAIGETKLENDQLTAFNALTLDKALEMVPGVSTSITGGTRNEQLFFVRGFDRFQTPLFVDGIRVYLPADNRLDIGFFTTANLAQVQVEKGYVSVLSGPGALGGAINLVTRKPTKEYEADARIGLTAGNELGYNGYNASVYLGHAESLYYVSASGTLTKTDQFRMSDDFSGTTTQAKGDRNNSSSRNYSLNLKAGYTPNASDEYSISYTGQWGRKEAPYSVADTLASQRNWTWPYWNVQNVYFLSNTALSDAAYVKSKVFYSSFLNGLYSYDDASFTAQTLPKSFRSLYSDYAYGANLETGYSFGGVDTFKLSGFYRHDSHTEWQIIYKPAFTEPKQTSVEDTWSIAAENRFNIAEKLTLVAGLSYDYRHLLKAEDYNDPTTAGATGSFAHYPVHDGSALNVQGELIYALADGGNLHASISDRARFPTLFDRFSTKFGTTISNAALETERAINYEIGGADTFYGIHVEGAVFYSRVTKAIANVPILFCDTTSTAAKKTCTSGGVAGVSTTTTQTQNVGAGDYTGFELSASGDITDTLFAGLSYGYVDRALNAQGPANPALTTGYHLTGMPNSNLFAYLAWTPVKDLTLRPSIQTDSNRWSTNTAGTLYYKTGSFFLTNFQAEYQFTDNLGLSLGVKNLFDVNYTVTYGYPSEGRNYFFNLRVKS